MLCPLRNMLSGGQYKGPPLFHDRLSWSDGGIRPTAIGWGWEALDLIDFTVLDHEDLFGEDEITRHVVVA